jgi:hypothetical protein
MAREYGEPTPSQLEKINQLAKKPLEKEEVFVFTSKMVGDKLIEERKVKLDKTLLSVYKNDAMNGIAFMLDHPWAGFLSSPKPAYNYGRTFDARIKKGDLDGEQWALHGDVYLVRGREKDGVSTDSIIQDIEDGVLFDVSIGFSYRTRICSICGKEIWRDGCDHWPGREYDSKLCYIIAKPPGNCFELSGVFAGAYDSAEIYSDSGFIEEQGFELLTDNYKRVEPGAPIYGVYSAHKGQMLSFARRDSLEKKVIITKEGGTEMDEKKYTQEEVDALVEKAVEKYKLTDENTTAKASNIAPLYITQEQATEKLGKELSADDVLRFAKEGIAYHTESVEEAIKEGVRAMGNDFPAETWKLTFATMSTKQIKDIASTWYKQAKEKIPAGRKTDPEAGEKASVDFPDEAFKC